MYWRHHYWRHWFRWPMHSFSHFSFDIYHFRVEKHCKETARSSNDAIRRSNDGTALIKMSPHELIHKATTTFNDWLRENIRHRVNERTKMVNEESSTNNGHQWGTKESQQQHMKNGSVIKMDVGGGKEQNTKINSNNDQSRSRWSLLLPRSLARSNHYLWWVWPFLCVCVCDTLSCKWHIQMAIKAIIKRNFHVRS